MEPFRFRAESTSTDSPNSQTINGCLPGPTSRNNYLKSVCNERQNRRNKYAKLYAFPSLQSGSMETEVDYCEFNV